MIRTTVAVVFVALAFVTVQAARADYDAAQRAWEAGQVEEALAQWREAAQSGDPRAMLALGRLHVQGLGTLQDYVQAHLWFNLAASRGEAAALQEREAIAAKMTPEQVARAQQLAAAWRPVVGETAAAGGAAGTPAAGGATAEAADRPPPRAIREAQQLLAALGYRPGPADGIWGARTGRAYRTFLRDADLPTGEIVTPATLRALRKTAARHGVVTEPDPTTTVGGTAQGSREPDVARRAPAPDALHRAARAGDITSLKAALSAAAAVNAPDAQGWTALMHAANTGHALLIEPLLSAGADPDARAPDGATALFIAALHGYSEIVAALLRAGADAAIAGPKGRTPLDMARSLNHSRILALPEVVTFEEAQARREHEAAELRRREEEKRGVEEESRAFERAKASDTLPAWVEFLSSWCPGGKLCATAGSRRDESITTSLTGRTFGGDDSLGKTMSIHYSSPNRVTVVHDSNKYSGTWEVGAGRVRIRFEHGGFLSCSAVAVLVDRHLEGREECTVDSLFYKGQKSFTWRLAERAAAEIEAENTTATRQHRHRSEGK